MSASLTIVGNLTRDPELRFTASGRPVCNFDVAVNRGYKDRTGEWVEQPTVFQRVSFFGPGAENAAESLRKGHRVITVGTLVDGSYTADDGTKRTVHVLEATEVGAALTKARATIVKVEREQRQLAPAPAGV